MAGWLNTQGGQYGAALDELLYAVDEVRGGGGALSASGGGHGWVCAEIPASRLHLTLVPPPAAVARGTFGSKAEAEEARACALSRLGAMAGAWVEVRLVRYIAARAGSRRLGLWEVEGVDGLISSSEHAPQAAIYHVTDVGALVECQPRDAAELMVAIRHAAASGAAAKSSGSSAASGDGSEWKVQAMGTEWQLSEPVPPVSITSGEIARVMAQVQVRR